MEMETPRELLIGDPGDRARRRIESMDRRVKTPNHFEVEGYVFPDAERGNERPVRKSLTANRPASTGVSQVDHAAVELLANINIPAGNDPSYALCGSKRSLEKCHRVV